MDQAIRQAAQFVKDASKMVVLTGAGMSTEAGIPDFRSKDGWWNRIDPLTLATPEALESNYDQFHAFYAHRLEGLEALAPTQGYLILAQWEQAGRVQLIATQNVDGLHHKAGSEQVEELHGSITSFRCHQCGKSVDRQQFLKKESCSCGGRIRPDVVLFGEQLPQQAWEVSLKAVQEAEVVIVIGTSLQVYPVNTLPSLTDGRLILINAESTGHDSSFDIVIHGKAVASLLAIDSLL